MTYDHALTSLKNSLEAHNFGLDPEDADKKIDVSVAVRAIKLHGGTTLEGLLTMTEMHFKECGFPPVVASLAVRTLSKIGPPLDHPAQGGHGGVAYAPHNMGGAGGAAQVMVLRDERTALESAPDDELLGRYNHTTPGIVGEILDKRAQDARGNRRPFLFFVGTTLQVEQSRGRLQALRDGKTVTETLMIEGRPRRPFLVGAPLKKEPKRRNPIFFRLSLAEPGLVCTVTNKSWEGVPFETCGIVEIAARSGELGVGEAGAGAKQAAMAVIKMAKDPNGAAEIRETYPVATARWDELPERQRPSGEFDEDEQDQTAARPEERHGLPFGDGRLGRMPFE